MTVTHTIREAHGNMRRAAGKVRDGAELNRDDRYSLNIIRAYCEALLAGESVEPDRIYHRAFGGKYVKPEDEAA